MAKDPDPVRAATVYGFGGAGGTDCGAAGWSEQGLAAAPGGGGVPLTWGIAGRAFAMR